MRTNMPVTNNEYILTDADSIVSITDPQGKITFINEDFKRISGFREERVDWPAAKYCAPSGYAGGSLCRLLGDLEGGQTVDRAGKKPLQKWRLLLGFGQRHACV